MSDEQTVKAVFNPVDGRIVVHRSEAEQGMATVREVSAGLLDAYQRAREQLEAPKVERPCGENDLPAGLDMRHRPGTSGPRRPRSAPEQVNNRSRIRQVVTRPESGTCEARQCPRPQRLPEHAPGWTLTLPETAPVKPSARTAVRIP